LLRGRQANGKQCWAQGTTLLNATSALDNSAAEEEDGVECVGVEGVGKEFREVGSRRFQHGAPRHGVEGVAHVELHDDKVSRGGVVSQDAAKEVRGAVCSSCDPHSDLSLRKKAR